MQDERFQFGQHFEKIILKEILEANSQFISWVPDIKPEFFSTKSYAFLYSVVSGLHKTYSKIPTFEMVGSEIAGDSGLNEEEKSFYKKKLAFLKLKESKLADSSYVLTKLEIFIKRQKYLVAFDSGIDLLEAGEIPELDKMFSEIIRRGTSEEYLGVTFFKNPKQRIYKEVEHTKRYKFLIPELDEHLRNGGLKPGETVMWLAPPGTGKSMGLIHTSKAWMMQKLKGVYYTLQLPEDDISERFDATFSGIPTRQLMESPGKVINKLNKYKKKLGEDALLIKYFPRKKATMGNIRRHLYQLREDGYNPRFIVIDFLNYLNPEYSSRKDAKDSSYYAGGDTAGEFITFCQEEKLLGATGIQANRLSGKDDVVTIYHVADSFEMAMEATLVISVNRTSDERQADRARLFIAKYTFGEDQIIIPISTNYGKGSLYKRL